MLTDLSIENKLVFGLGAIAAIILFLLAVAYNNFSKLSAARGFLLTGNESLVAPMTSEFKTGRQHLAKAIALTATKEISANTAQLLRTMEEATAVADTTTSAIVDAQNKLKRMDLAMQHMVSATASINSKLAALSQAAGASQIPETMMQLSDATQQTVESLKATSEAVHQLQYAAGDLQTSVANFAVQT